MTTKFKKSFSPMLICWNDIKIHLGFEDSYFVPPPTIRAPDGAKKNMNNIEQAHVLQFRYQVIKIWWFFAS